MLHVLKLLCISCSVEAIDHSELHTLIKAAMEGLWGDGHMLVEDAVRKP